MNIKPFSFNGSLIKPRLIGPSVTGCITFDSEKCGYTFRDIASVYDYDTDRPVIKVQQPIGRRAQGKARDCAKEGGMIQDSFMAHERQRQAQRDYASQESFWQGFLVGFLTCFVFFVLLLSNN